MSTKSLDRSLSLLRKMVVHEHLQFLLLLLLFPFATPLTFNFSTFPNDTTSLFIEGDAYTDGTRLRLTKSAKEPKLARNIGRATYSQPFLLRGNDVSGKLRLADFTTHFTFVIDSQGNKSYGDGFVFFLAPNGSLLNTLFGGGGHLGLPVADLPAGNEYPFVAVEFDIYRNPSPTFDPADDHVGVDVNNLRSKTTMSWNGDVPNAKLNSASVSYNSSSKTVSVAYTTFVNDTAAGGVQTQVMRYLNYVVDLRQYLPDWVIVGFSGATGDKIALLEIISWNFTSTPIVDEFVDATVDTTPPVAAPVPNSDIKSRNGNTYLRIAVGIGVGLSILVAALALVWFIFRRKRVAGGRNGEDLDDEFERGTGPIKFMYSELARATNNFDEGEKLGEGGFGGVYRGFIRDLNAYVAVKRVSKGSKQGLKEYAAEVKIIGRLRHRNLVQLIGWCHENGELLLVYEFMPHGSLDSYLFKEGSFLSWEVRYKIALGLGSGVLYLHEGCEQCILHRDIKASNVMLDLNFNVKLGDFGLARLVEHEKGSLTTIVAGTRGYMALDYVVTGKASKESDVYSFGVVALEIACGRKSIDFDLEDSRINLVEWVWGLFGEGKLIEAADPKLCGEFDERQIECVMIVGLWCAHPDYTCRPPIQQVIQVLNFKEQLPTLPAVMPMAPSFARPVMTFSDNISGSEIGHTMSNSNTTNSLALASSSANQSSPL